ncbi:MAG: T9SS type A sorting domain-containing protein [Bacteroidetes bacterium]|nr:T9SS type A sorting domain-containing protein [Bacteroidota bacterium]
MRSRRIYVILLALVPLFLSAQDYERVSEIRVEQNGRTLLSPWAGGLNAAHLGMADINNDGSEDLFVYDKDGKRKYVFIHTGGDEYVYEPTYADNFPTIKDWFLLEDYNCDDIPDLIMHNRFSPQTYLGSYDSGSLTFSFDKEIIYYENTSLFYLNLFTDPTHRPIMVDVNGDGDKDFLAFDFNLIRVDYYENQREERALSCDSLLFKRVDRCWGNFKDNGLTLNQTLGDTCVLKFNRVDPTSAETAAHPGGTAIDIVDNNGDGIYDMFIGDLTFKRLNLLSNNGSREVANIYAQDDSFPSYGEFVDITIFPAPYVMDIDHDGDEDLVVAPFLPGAIENYENVSYYKNNGSVNEPYELERKDFLTGDMIDVGELATPAFFDHNNDGLEDMVIGTGGYYESDGEYLFSLTLYENTGTAELPAFRLSDRNYLDLDMLQFDDMRPFFGDLDNDNDKDLIIGEKDGKILILDNNNGIFENTRFLTDDQSNDIDIGKSAHPVLFDFDENGTLDLIIGNRDGDLTYYENTGSAGSFEFTFRTDTMGSVLSHPATSTLRYSSPAFGDFDNDGKADLLVGGADSRIKLYSDIGTDYAAVFPLKNDNFLNVSEFEFVGSVRPRLAPAAADISNDGRPEILLGISNGGLEMYSTEIVDTNDLAVGFNTVSDQIGLYPNPADHFLTVDWSGVFERSQVVHVRVTDLLGRDFYTKDVLYEELHRLDVSNLSRGMYHVSVSQGMNVGAIKFFKY